MNNNRKVNAPLQSMSMQTIKYLAADPRCYAKFNCGRGPYKPCIPPSSWRMLQLSYLSGSSSSNSLRMPMLKNPEVKKPLWAWVKRGIHWAMSKRWACVHADEVGTNKCFVEVEAHRLPCRRQRLLIPCWTTKTSYRDGSSSHIQRVLCFD